MSNIAFASFAPPIRPQSDLRQAITAAYRRDEGGDGPPAGRRPLDLPMKRAVRMTALDLVTTLRATQKGTGVEGWCRNMRSPARGVALMCLAEALLRIPDNATRDALIRDKIAAGDWGRIWAGALAFRQCRDMGADRHRETRGQRR
jgi:RHH-type proline utilization regulon transcriptional repressor/proline dehydrogenase/delta 1-pyrroline-5-carboxylate dehydrogenase